MSKRPMPISTIPALPVPGFSWAGINIGIKDDSLDYALACCETPCAAAGVFTRNNFPGAPVVVGRQHLRDGQLQAIVVNSKNANVATGEAGLNDARRMCATVGQALGLPPEQVLPSSTGVIGVALPMQKIAKAPPLAKAALGSEATHLEQFARAIMTTDTRPKMVSVKIGQATLTGVAKGAGMIEPHMATMLAYFFTDAQLDAAQLQPMLTRVVNRSFNRVSVDTDTSTSDTVVIMANGLAGPVPPGQFEQAFAEAAIKLARDIAADGEGATKLIELTVTGAQSEDQALKTAKAVLNSPLVKTAVHGADPNWGRFVMAVGKVFEYPVPLEDLRIGFGEADSALVITQDTQPEDVLDRISEYLRQAEVKLQISVGSGPCQETVWGCDLSAEYVSINADYTT